MGTESHTANVSTLPAQIPHHRHLSPQLLSLQQCVVTQELLGAQVSAGPQTVGRGYAGEFHTLPSSLGILGRLVASERSAGATAWGAPTRGQAGQGPAQDG